MTKTILAIGAVLALAACSSSNPTPTTYDVPPVPPLSVVGDVSPSPAGEGYIQSSSSIHHGAFTFEVQHRLKALGYYEGEVDGANGPMTRAAVRHFQHDNHLHETGVVDQHTDSALRLSAGH
jgi:peptidoglycan hydrolase-like protein with peptidoglycan-binding domain